MIELGRNLARHLRIAALFSLSACAGGGDDTHSNCDEDIRILQNGETAPNGVQVNEFVLNSPIESFGDATFEHDGSTHRFRLYAEYNSEDITWVDQTPAGDSLRQPICIDFLRMPVNVLVEFEGSDVTVDAAGEILQLPDASIIGQLVPGGRQEVRGIRMLDHVVVPDSSEPNEVVEVSFQPDGISSGCIGVGWDEREDLTVEHFEPVIRWPRGHCPASNGG